MKSAVLLRIDDDGKRTLGVLRTEGALFSMLEPPWRDNARDESCIPTGVYECQFLPRSASGKFRNVWWVRAVPGRAGILIHNGVVVAHTEGCPLIGRHHKTFDGQVAVWRSREALREFNKVMGRKPFRLEVRNA